MLVKKERPQGISNSLWEKAVFSFHLVDMGGVGEGEFNDDTHI